MGQIIGLKAVHAGNPLPKGVKDAEAADLMKAFTKISQPYNGGVSTNFAIPSDNVFRTIEQPKAIRNIRV